MRSILLAQHAYRWRKDNIRDVEYAQHDVVVVALEAQINVHTISLRISEVAFVESIYADELVNGAYAGRELELTE